MSITDQNIQLTAQWSKHIQSDGSQIAPGSPDPINCGFVHGMPGYPTAMLVYNDGVAYAAVEVYAHRPLAVNTGNLQLSFDLLIDEQTLVSQVIETDTKLVIGGKMRNFSLQRIMKTNMIQVSNQKGDWVDTGIIAPALVPGTPQRHVINYGFDVTSGGYGIQAISIDGQTSLIRYSLEELLATTTNWPDGAYIQVQNCLGPNGGSARILVDNMQYIWW